MEAKLDMLRRTVDSPASAQGGGDSARWKSGSAGKPITRGYVKGVMEAPRPKVRTSLGDAAAQSPGPKPKGAVSDFVKTGGDACDERDAGSPPNSRAASNLQTAVKQQTQESQEVVGLLSELQLDRYIGIFLENGLDSIDVVQEMQESHMRELGMAMGHALKLQKRLAELRPAAAEVSQQPLPTSPAAQRAPTPTLTPAWKRVNFSAEEAEVVPVSSNPQPTTMKLADGNFDEAESAASFQEALRAWREGGSATKTSNNGTQKEADRSQGLASPKPGVVGSFWAAIGSTEVDLKRCSTPVRAPTEPPNADSGTQQDALIGEEKACCYQCYKQFFKRFAVERSDPRDTPHFLVGSASDFAGPRALCSEACANQWQAAVEAQVAAHKQRQQEFDTLREAQQTLEEHKASAMKTEGVPESIPCPEPIPA